MAKFKLDINALLPKVQCPSCGASYPFNAKLCPECGEPKPEKAKGEKKLKVRFPGRAAASTASTMEGTAERAGAILNGRWQLMFALILAAAVLLAVVVLAVNGDAPGVGTPARQQSAAVPGNAQGSTISISDTYLPTPSPSPEPTPTVAQNPITSMEITFLNNGTGPDITLNKDGQIAIQLELRTFPQNAEVSQKWSSSNENILTVDDTGFVQVVGVDPVNGSNATIKVECGGLEASLIIRVPQYQAQHLKANQFNAP